MKAELSAGFEIIRVSMDFAKLREYMKLSVRKKEIPQAHDAWIRHLIHLHGLTEICPGLTEHLHLSELQGLMILRNVLDKEQNAKDCPRCHEKTSSLYACENCGADLRGKS